MGKRVFITGTDTDVGKTVCSSILCKQLGWNYWKPIQCGLEDLSDSERVGQIIGHERVAKEAYRFKAAVSPHYAAALERVVIDLSTIEKKFKQLSGNYLIEGAGGLLVPLNEELLMIDLIQHLRLPTLLVARTALGTLNHTLLSIEALRKRSINLWGVIMVGHANVSNLQAIEKYGAVKVLGHIPYFSNQEEFKQVSSPFDFSKLIHDGVYE